MKKIKLKKGTREWLRWKQRDIGESLPPTPERPTVLAGDMWAHMDFGNPNERYQKFLSQGRSRFSRLLDSLMLYETVWVPTQDFMSATILVGVLGDKAVLEMLEAGDIKFVRVKGALAYIGNGGGLQSFKILERNNEVHPPFGTNEEALEWALGGLTVKPDSLLYKLILDNTITVDMAKLNDVMKHETYTDILKSNHLREAFAVRNKNLDRLAGIGPDQVRMAESLDPSVFGDEIDTVLRISRANLELYLASHCACMDSTTGTPIGHVLKGKMERVRSEQAPFDAYAQLKELSDIPDFTTYVLDAQPELRHFRIADILRPKHSRDGADFRTWFHKNCRDGGADVAKRYVDLLHTTEFANTMTGKTLRFLSTTAMGFIGPVAGVLAGALDTFFGDYLRKASAKFFIQDIRQIQ